MIKSFRTNVDYGDCVTLKTEPTVVRIVSGFLIRKGSLNIGLVCGSDETWHLPEDLEPVKHNFVVRGFR